jgi:hypothetical protein
VLTGSSARTALRSTEPVEPLEGLLTVAERSPVDASRASTWSGDCARSSIFAIEQQG